jgi:hypothetical protein
LAWTVTAVNDGIRGKDSVVIHGGQITVDAAGDGILSNNDTEASKGYVMIDGGSIHLVSSDDGINGADGSGSSGGTPGGPPGTSSGNARLYINGGYIVVNALGDGVDVNGSVTMTAGTLLVDGPTRNDKAGTTYIVYSGGSSTGTVVDGLYTGGTYTPGKELGKLTID